MRKSTGNYWFSPRNKHSVTGKTCVDTHSNLTDEADCDEQLIYAKGAGLYPENKMMYRPTLKPDSP